MTDPTDLTTQVQDALADTPYTVTPTPEGFAVAVDLRRRGALWDDQVRRLRSTIVHHVTFDPPRRRFTVTDEIRTVTWHLGVGHLGASLGTSRGRYRRISVGGDSDGPWSFDSDRARRQVVDIVTAAGWSPQPAWEAKVGAAFVLIGLVAALLTVAVLIF